MTVPAVLGPLAKLWFGLSAILGTVMSKLLLSLVFFLVVTPMGVLRRLVESDRLPSMILWGPPGTGKTSLARLLAHLTRGHFVALSAVTAGVAEVRKVVGEARERQRLLRKRTILFLDEIHRFNKAQQDVILPHVEEGTITLVGATTENPSFYLTGALLSRVKVLVLPALSAAALQQVLARAARSLPMVILA